MATYKPILELCLLLGCLTTTKSMTFTQSKCKGAHVILQCKPRHLIQVETVNLIHSATCDVVSSSDAVNCTRSSNKFHACTGVRTCIVKVPEILIEECGISNSLEITYSCIKESEVTDICNVSTDLTATSGYLATPGYPTIWQPTTGTCSITINLSRDWRIRFYIQDQGQEATDQPQGCIFLVTFRALLNKRRTGLFPETSICLDNGYTRNQLIYESTTNIVQLQYRVLLPIIKTGDKFGFLFYYEGYQLVSGTAGAMSSTTVPPTIVLQPDHVSAHPDNMIQLRPFFRTTAVAVVRPVTQTVNTEQQQQIRAQVITGKPHMMRTDPLGIVIADRQQTRPLDPVHDAAPQANMVNLDPKENVQLRDHTNTVDTGTLKDVQIHRHDSNITQSKARNSPTTQLARAFLFSEPEQQRNNLDKDPLVMTTPFIVDVGSTKREVTVMATDAVSVHRVVQSTSSSAMSNALPTPGVSSPSQPTSTSSGTRPRDASIHPVRSHVVIVRRPVNDSRDFSNMRTRGSHQDIAAGPRTDHLMTTRLGMKTGSKPGVHGTTTTFTDVRRSTTDGMTDLYNTTTTFTDVYNTTVISANSEWKTKWAKIVGGLMVALAVCFMLIIIAIMVAERQRKRRRRELHIQSIFDNISHLGCEDDTSQLARDTAFNNSIYTGSTATTVTLPADYGWQNEAYTACVHEYRNCIMPERRQAGVPGADAALYENCSGTRGAGNSPLLKRADQFWQDYQQTGNDLSRRGSRANGSSTNDPPSPPPAHVVVSGSGPQQNNVSRRDTKKTKPPVPVRRSLIFNNHGNSIDDNMDHGRTAVHEQDSYNSTTKHKQNGNPMHAVVIELRPAAETVYQTDEFITEVKPNHLNSTLPVYSYTTP